MREVTAMHTEAGNHGVFRGCAVLRRAFRGVVRDSPDADGPSRQNRDGPNVERVRVSS
ncbi:hypothetical protein ACIQKE_31460 [Streptomyces griseoviridis]|uniref:Uncharacterized protein n=1 Tax=Streptomyces hintoniae TaxID=3075521 RepID=A0ABU2UKF4_9ACTN|nr:hypothetical protein [Streptomyces sp. DSM 41014]MDT0473741.1 hypothetical protein [Streptomyces sp. DSM 41014]